MLIEAGNVVPVLHVEHVRHPHSYLLYFLTCSISEATSLFSSANYTTTVHPTTKHHSLHTTTYMSPGSCHFNNNRKLDPFQNLFVVTSNILGAENDGSWEAINSTVCAHACISNDYCGSHRQTPLSVISAHTVSRTTQASMLLCLSSIPLRH